MSIRTSLIKVVDAARAIAGPTGVDARVNQLTIRTRTWSGSRLGVGTASDSDLVLPARYPIRLITSQEIVAAPGLYEIGDILVDHITPFDGVSVGYTPEDLKPTVTTNNVEIIYVITGEHAGTYRCLELRTYRPFTSQLVLRRRASVADDGTWDALPAVAWDADSRLAWE
jgi:hypothetical protein